MLPSNCLTSTLGMNSLVKVHQSKQEDRTSYLYDFPKPKEIQKSNKGQIQNGGTSPQPSG